MAKAVTEGGNSKKKLSKDDAKLVGVIQRIGAVDKKPVAKKATAKTTPAPVKATAKPVPAKKPVGAYSKGRGVSDVKFNGKTKSEKFENFATNLIDTTETRKDRGQNPSMLYAAARKLGIDQRKIKALVDSTAETQKKYGAATEKKTSIQDMKDMQSRSAANAKKAGK